MRFNFDRGLLWGLLVVLVIALAWLFDPGGAVQRMREMVFETVGQIFPRAGPSNAVAVIDIDRESLARNGPWPWRRSLIGKLIDKVSAQSPGAIAVDVLLSGPDRKGPAALAKELAAMSGSADPHAIRYEDDDKILAGAIAKAGNVVLGLVLDDAGRDSAAFRAPIIAEGSTVGIAPRSSAGLLAPFEPLAEGAAGIGVLSLQEGRLGRVASAPLIAVAGGDVFASLALEAVRVSRGASLFIVKDAPIRITAGSVEVPLDDRAELRLHFSRSGNWTHRTLSAWSLLAEPEGQRPALAGKIVLIGSSAPEAGAFLPVAGSPLMPTVQIQAEVIEQILAGSFLTRPKWALWWEEAAIVVLGTAAVLTTVWLAPGWAAAAALALVLGWIALVVAAFLRNAVLIDPVGPLVSVVVAGNVTAFNAFIRTRALKTTILQKFERYVPPEVVARLVREPKSLRLDGEMREVTALLTDVEQFSMMTENSAPRALVAALDQYFDCVTELIVSHGGMVDKIVGDAVLAFFNIPAPLPGHTEAAVHCAQAIVAATEEYRLSPDPASMGFGRTRCGIETGVAIVGDVGGRRRLDYTAYGVVVNKAARFQEANKSLKSSICIGPTAAAMLGGKTPLRCLGGIVVRGMQGVCDVYEPWRMEVPAELRQAYAAAVALRKSDPDKARQVMAELARRMPDDPVIVAWLERMPG